MEVHYNPNSVANILSFKKVNDLAGVTIKYDSEVERAIYVYFSCGKAIKFIEDARGLFYYDTKNADKHIIKIPVNSYSFLSQTVESNKAKFTKAEILGADTSLSLQARCGWPSTTDFKKYVKNNLIDNCPINTDDIDRAITIYGQPTELLRGRHTRSNPGRSIHKTRIPLPSYIMTHHKNVELFTDFFFVNKLPFLLTKSGNVYFASVQAVHSHKASEIKDGLEQVKQVYENRGFNIVAYHGDNEFELMREFLEPESTLHICAKNEHIGPIEREVRMVKGRSRSITHGLPFKRYTKLMTKDLVYKAVTRINSFPAKNGTVSQMI